MKIFAIIFVICAALLADCPPAESNPVKENGRADVLTIGLTPEQNIFKQIERYTPLAEYLFMKTGLKIKLKVLTRYGNLIDNFKSMGMDGAFFGSFTYALAHAKIGVEALARPEDSNGLSTYHGLIFVRKDSQIGGITDMRGKRFAFVDRATTAGFILPLAYFKEHGLKDYKAYFKEVYFTGTHEDAIYDVLNRRADIGAAKNTVFTRLAGADERLRRELKILKRSPDVPENSLALRKNLDASTRTAIQEALLDMHNNPAGQSVLKKFGAQRFIKTTARDYDPVFRYVREIDLDLARYDYRNE